MAVELRVLQDGKPVQSVPLGDGTLTLGRGPQNGLCIAEPSVSWQHAVLWTEMGRVWVRDTGSSNGTWLGEQRVHGPSLLSHGDRLRIGLSSWIEVYAPESHVDARRYFLEDVETGVRVPLLCDRLNIGGDPDANLCIPGAPLLAAVVIVHPNGEIWLGDDDSERQLEVGETVVVAGRSLRLVVGTGTHEPTVQARKRDRYPYRLVVNLEGGTGPTATLERPGEEGYRVDAGNRAVLLFLLARRLDRDRKANLDDDEAGWCGDDEVQSGIWGRGGDDNKLHVLIHRLRAELKKAGFDPWFIEKRHRYLRVRVSEVAVR